MPLASRKACAGRSTATLPGQAQKEGFVNEVVARLDALLFLAIEGTQSAPPSILSDGQSWLIGASPTGEWSGHEGQMALRQFGNWLFAAPVSGIRLLDKSTGQERRYLTSWQAPAKPAAPSGGTTIDAEARAAINLIIAALVTSGIVPAS
ncbi:MAG: DUF2793 domain-containing protein [Novosphingobium sp.]